MAADTKRLYLRVPPDLLEALDAWRAKQPDDPSRSEAVRHLLRLGLAASKGGLTEMLLEVSEQDFEKLRAALNEFEALAT